MPKIATSKRVNRFQAFVKKAPLQKIYDRLYDCWGPQFWWPGETPLEISVGAILTQNTAWTNVEKAIENLKKADVLELERLIQLPETQLADYIRPSGFFKIKARRLRAFLLFVKKEHGSLNNLFKLSTAALRDRLLDVHGIGPETADSILLYAAERPVFVVDAYTRRMLSRHGWLGEKVPYDDVARLFTANLPSDTSLSLLQNP